MRLWPKNCDKCNEPLDEGNTFSVRILGGPPPKVVCGSCHDDFVLIVEDLFLSKKGGRYNSEKVAKINAEWFSAPVVQRSEQLPHKQ